MSEVNEIRTSLQIDSNFQFVMGMSPWPLCYVTQQRLLASRTMIESDRLKLESFIAGSPAKLCIPSRDYRPALSIEAEHRMARDHEEEHA